MESHQHYVQGVAWDPLGHYVCSQSNDRTCKVGRFVCVCVCVHVHVHVHVHVCFMQVYVHIYIYIYIFAYVNIGDGT